MTAIIGAILSALAQALRGLRRDSRRAWPSVVALPLIALGIALPLGARRGLEQALMSTGREGAAMITSAAATYLETSRIEAQQADQVTAALSTYAARTADGQPLVGVESIAYPEIVLLDDDSDLVDDAETSDATEASESTDTGGDAETSDLVRARDAIADALSRSAVGDVQTARTARLRGVPVIARDLYPALELIDGAFLSAAAVREPSVDGAPSQPHESTPRDLLVGELAAARLGISADRLRVGAELKLDGVLFEVVGRFRSRDGPTWFDGELWCLHDDFRYFREPKPVGLMLYQRPQASEFARMVNAIVWVPRDRRAEANAYHDLRIAHSLPADLLPPTPQTSPSTTSISPPPAAGFGLRATDQVDYYRARVRDLDPVAVATAVVASCFGLTALLFVLAFAPWSLRLDDVVALAVLQGATEVSARLIVFARAVLVGVLAAGLAAGGAALLVQYGPPVTVAGGACRLSLTLDEYAITVAAVLGVSLLGHAPVALRLTRSRIAQCVA